MQPLIAVVANHDLNAVGHGCIILGLLARLVLREVVRIEHDFLGGLEQGGQARRDAALQRARRQVASLADYLLHQLGQLLILVDARS